MKLNCNECHLWFIEDQAITASSLLQHYQTLLSSEEQKQHLRFHFQQDRHQYLITRSHLRSILSLYYPKILPEEWHFQKNYYGKPYIANSIDGHPIFFNVSHTNGLIVVLIATKDHIGVDAEYLKRDNNIIDLASNVFSPSENEFFQNLPPEQQPRNFFLLWTLKEAYIKARGVGIKLPMTDLIYHNKEQSVELHNKENHWQFWSIEPNQDYQVSVALSKEGENPLHFSMYKIHTFEEIESVNYPMVSIPVLSN